MQGIAGVLSYEHRATRRGVIMMFLLMVIILLGIMFIPMIPNGNKLEYSGMSDSGVFPLFMIFTMIRASRKDTVYLITRPLSRRNVWLGIMVHMIILTLILAIIRTIFELIGFGAVGPLARLYPTKFAYALPSDWSAAPFTPGRSHLVLWRGITDIISAGAFAYCYGCLLQRWKGWTIGLSIALPVLGFVIFALPVLTAFLSDVNRIVENGQTVLFTSPTILQKWIDIIGKILEWVQKYWNILFWSAAAVAIPVSFCVMRTSRHTA